MEPETQPLFNIVDIFQFHVKLQGGVEDYSQFLFLHGKCNKFVIKGPKIMGPKMPTVPGGKIPDSHFDP